MGATGCRHTCGQVNKLTCFPERGALMAKKKSGGKRGQFEGSIYLHKDGRWRAIVPARFSANGKRRTLVGSARDGNTREDLARRLAVALTQKPTETLPPSRETVKSFLARWLEGVEARVRPKTLESYRHAVDRLIVPAIGTVKLQALAPQHVMMMMRDVRTKGRAVRSIAYARTTLRIALADAKRWGLVTRNVADREFVDPPRMEKVEVDAYSAAEVTKILAAVKDPEDRLLFATLVCLGLRIGEGLGLRWSDIDFATNTLRVARAVQRQQGKGLVFVPTKTTRSRRALLMPAELVAQLQVHRREQLKRRLKLGDGWDNQNLVFPNRIGGPADSRNVLRALHRAEAAAKVQRKGLHKLRHSFATLALGAGVTIDVVSDVLGHSSIGVTMGTYVSYVVARQEKSAGVMGAIVALPPTK